MHANLRNTGVISKQAYQVFYNTLRLCNKFCVLPPSAHSTLPLTAVCAVSTTRLRQFLQSTKNRRLSQYPQCNDHSESCLHVPQLTEHRKTNLLFPGLGAGVMRSCCGRIIRALLLAFDSKDRMDKRLGLWDHRTSHRYWDASNNVYQRKEITGQGT